MEEEDLPQWTKQVTSHVLENVETRNVFIKKYKCGVRPLESRVQVFFLVFLFHYSGAQNLIFWVSIAARFLEIFLKKTFFEPSRRVPLGGFFFSFFDLL